MFLKGKAISLSLYDEMNRLTLASDGEGGYVQYTYDSLGNITKMYTGLSQEIDKSLPYNPETDSYALTRYEYDHLGNLEKVIDPYGEDITYTYDISGKLKTTLDKAGNLKTNTYDSLSRLTAVSVLKGNVTDSISYTYDNFNNLKSMTDSSGITYYASVIRNKFN